MRNELPIPENDIVLYSQCPHAFYLSRMEGKNKIPTTPVAAQVLFFMAKRKNLFEVRDKDIGVLFEDQRRAGQMLKDIEDMDSEELEEYMPFSSAEAFGGSLKGTWSKILDKNMYRGTKIHWNFKNQVFTTGNYLKKAGANYFKFILDQGPPVMGLIDKERDMEFEGVQLRVKLPEIRYSKKPSYRIFLDRPSLFEFNGELRGRRRANLDESPLVTLALYGLSELLHKYPVTYLPKLGAPVGYWGEIENSKEVLIPDLVYRHINLGKQEITSARRDDSDLDGLRKTIDDFLEGVGKQRFPPNQGSCSQCRYNILGNDGKPVCNYRNEKVAPSVPRHYFDEENFRIVEEDDTSDDAIYFTSKVDRKEAIPKRKGIETATITHDIGMLIMKMTELKDVVLVNSSYNSEIYGVVYAEDESFESAMIRKMDQRLLQISTEKKKKVINGIEFMDFDLAGKIRSEKRLKEIGYRPDSKGRFTKEYDDAQ